MVSLPIDPFLPEISAALEKHTALLLSAQPGTGKTTRVPAAMLSCAFTKGREIWVLEPRRLAAKMAARRVAFERGEDIGKTVGYQFRFENVGGPQTKLRFLTEGMILRHLLSDPTLSRVAAVVLDEFHERHLHGDTALAILRELQKTQRPDLRLVVMSATLRTEELETFLGGPKKLDIAAPHHPLAVRYSPLGDTYLDKGIARAVREVLSATDYPGGDILVFLPGMADMRRAETALGALCRERGIDLHLLHGELSKEEQDRAVNPGARRKVILATNVAESSLTIEGVNTVIDSGLHRSASYSSWSGMPSLRTRPISKASAIQRAGRAARTGPGLCVRLYASGDFEHRAPHETPEILRADLAQTLLELKSMGIVAEETFGWFQAPSTSSLQNARDLLHRLGALATKEPGASLTELGKQMAGFPLHPRLARLLIEADAHGCGTEAVGLAALVSEGMLETLDALDAVKRTPAPERVRRQFSAFLRSPKNVSSDWREALALCVLCAFPDRVGKLRPGQRTELLLSSGGSVRTDDLSAFGHDYFVVLDARETQGHGGTRGQVRATSVVAIEPEWLLDLKPTAASDEEALEWDGPRKRVLAKSRLRYDQLILEETPSEIHDTAKAVDVLLRSALSLRPDEMEKFSVHQWIEALTPVLAKDKAESLFSRQALAAEYGGKAFPTTPELVRRAVAGCVSFQELKDLDWESALLPPELFGRAFPSQVQLPGGRKVAVQYALGRPPWIESRLQDFFGMKQGPSILDGKLPLTLHLLAPNHVAVQVTTDLASFWKNTYPTVRRELSRNYPRHSWPEDPVNAKPPPPKPPRRA